MKLAFVYAGQGSQKVGMGADFYERYPLFRRALDCDRAGFDLREVCFQGPEEKLSQTRYTQPCMVAFAIGVTDLLAAEGIRPQAAAGLSLGEYSALYAAGVFDREGAVATVALRGRAMVRRPPHRAWSRSATTTAPGSWSSAARRPPWTGPGSWPRSWGPSGACP